MTETDLVSGDPQESVDGTSGSVEEKNQDMVQMYEKMFSYRYTDEDKEFIKTKETDLPDPPCVENWNVRSRSNWNQRGGGYQGRGGGYQGRGGGYYGGRGGNHGGGNRHGGGGGYYNRNHGNQGHYPGGNQRGGRGRDRDRGNSGQYGEWRGQKRTANMRDGEYESQRNTSKYSSYGQQQQQY